MRIWIPKFKIIEPNKAAVASTRMGGRYRLRAIAPNGINVRRESPWSDNLITDLGLNREGASSITHSTCVVGTGNTAPAITDEALDALLASTATIQSDQSEIIAASPYGLRNTWTYRFAQGAAAGNLAEVGVGWGAATLFSRALIVDGGGSPTTFPVQADEFLDVAYQLTVFPPLADFEDTIDISGSAHDVVLRPASVNASAGGAGWTINTGAGDNASFGGGGKFVNSATGATDGVIGAITGDVTGTYRQVSGDVVTNAAYTTGNFYRDFSLNWGLNQGNLAGFISVTRFVMATQWSMGFQCSYVPDIPKDASNVLTLNYRHRWDRV